MSDRLAVIVPTRGRPDNIRKVLDAWDFTDAWADADLWLAFDDDDPQHSEYWRIIEEREGFDGLQYQEFTEWLPMVAKLNETANVIVTLGIYSDRYSAIAFAGDDHLPRTIGWARRYLTVLRELGTGMVYGDDGYQGAKLSTEWAVTADAVRALGRMVPAPVDHLYCDNAMMDLYGGAGAMRHLPEIRIEHMHPIAGKAETDGQYQRVNSREQYKGDRQAYENWKNGVLSEQIATIKALRPGRPEEHPDTQRRTREAAKAARKVAAVRGSGPRKIERSGPSRFSAPPKPPRFPFTAEFRDVIGATPDDIAFTLADFAKAVRSDQEIVELGVYQARSALIMAWGAAQGNGAHVTAIDAWDLPGNTYHPPFTDPATREAAYANVERLGYSDRVHLAQHFASEVGAHWIKGAWGPGGGKPVGLLFVDDDHSYAGARAAIEAWAPHLADGAVIAVDDYGHPDWPGVAQAVDELVDNGFLAPIEIYHERLAVTRLAAITPETLRVVINASEPVEFVRGPAEIAEAAPDGWVSAPLPAPDVSRETVDYGNMHLVELRALGRQRGIAHAHVMGATRLIEELRAGE